MLDSMLVRKNVWSYLALVALPLAAARCGGDDDDSGAAAPRGGSAGAAGKGTAGKGGSSGGKGGAGKGGSSNSGGEAGETGTGGTSGSGGTGGSASGSAGESGASSGTGGAGTGGSKPNGGETNGGEASSSAGESSLGGESGDPACSEYPFVTCSQTLANVGTGDFELDFSLTTTQSEAASVIDQRPSCGAGESMWSVRIDEGKLFFESDDDATEEHYALCLSQTAVNDGNPHWITYRRVGQELRMYIDCKLETTCATPASLGSLPTLSVGHGACDVEGSGDGTHALDGTLESECVGRP